MGRLGCRRRQERDAVHVSAFAAAALLAFIFLAASFGCMAAFCVEVSQRAVGGERFLVAAGGLIAAGVTIGILASYL